MSVTDKKTGRIIDQDFIAVALGGDMNCYGVARTFYEAYGLKSVMLGKEPIFPTADSSLFSDRLYDKDLLEDDVLIRMLTEVQNRYPGVRKFMFACNDDYVRHLIHNKAAIEAISSDFIVPVISEELFDRLDDKDSFYEVCEEYGLPYPGSVVFDCAAGSLDDFVIPFDYPVFIKPSSNVIYFNFEFEGKQKGYKIDSREELRDVLGRIQAAGYPDKFIIQEYVDGDDEYMFIYSAYCDKAGKVRMMSGGQILMHDRTPELIGNYNAVGNARDDELMKTLASFLERIGFTGVCHFDIQYDRNRNGYVVFEINIRQGRSNYYMTASGMNYARLMAEDYLCEDSISANGNDTADQGNADMTFAVADDPFIVSNVSRLNLARAIGKKKVLSVPHANFYRFQLAPYDKSAKNSIYMLRLERSIMRDYMKYNK